MISIQKLAADGELAGCPFCGAPVEKWETEFGTCQVMECVCCHIRFVFPWHLAPEDLLEKWNRRTK